MGFVIEINNMFIPKLDLESIELEYWDINLENYEVNFEGELQPALEDLDEVRLKKFKYEYMLEN